MKLEDLRTVIALLPRARRRVTFWAIAGLILGGLEMATLGLLLVTVGVIVGNPQAEGGRVAWAMSFFPSRDSFLTTALVALFLAAAAKYVIGLVVERRNSRIAYEVGSGLQKRVYDNLLHAPFGFYHSQRHGTLTNAVTSLPFRAFQGVVFLPRMLLAIAGIGFMSIFLLLLSPWVFLGAAVFAAVYFLVVRNLVQKVVFRTNVERHGALQRQSEIVSEAMSGIRQIRVFGGEDQTLSEFGAEADRYAVNSATEAYTKIIPSATVQFLFIGVLAIVLLAANRAMSPEAFIAQAPVFVTYIYGAMRIMPMVGILNESALNMVASLPHARALQEWLDIEEDPLRGRGEAKLEGIGSGIVYRGVGFWFDEGQWVLRDVDLEIPARKVTAIIGPSGAGKSTVVDLLLKFIAPREGEVLVGGEHDLLGLDREEWFRHIGFVSQETFLFHVSIRENLAYSNKGASEAEMLRACDLAGIRDFIDQLPQGLDTMVGDRGVTLSGGQRQRLAIARALVRDPQLLILDEATNALDAETEAQVVDTIFELARDRTVVMIAHRLSILERADQVIALRAGKVAARGTYRELVDRGVIAGEEA